MPPPLGAIPDHVLEVARAVRNEPLPERISRISESLMDIPYLLDPLGEGTGHDADPFARYDAYDCLTYVEEVLALSLAGDPVHSAPIRSGLRYGSGERTYETRRHFMELQWIPGTVGDGWMKETTAEYGPVETYEREVTPATWQAWPDRSLFAMPDEVLPMGTMRLQYLSLETAMDSLQSIRPGSVFMAVREDRSSKPIWITHTGLIVPGDRPTLRHAANFRSGRHTREQSLAWYVEHMGSYEHWKSVGIAIFEPIEAGPRLSILAAEDWRAPQDPSSE